MPPNGPANSTDIAFGTCIEYLYIDYSLTRVVSADRLDSKVLNGDLWAIPSSFSLKHSIPFPHSTFLTGFICRVFPVLRAVPSSRLQLSDLVCLAYA